LVLVCLSSCTLTHYYHYLPTNPPTPPTHIFTMGLLSSDPVKETQKEVKKGMFALPSIGE
jgi:hypothetical protein